MTHVSAEKYRASKPVEPRASEVRIVRFDRPTDDIARLTATGEAKTRRHRVATKGALSALPTGADQHDVARLRRFTEKVTYEPNTGCWIWTGHATRAGYGTFGIGVRKSNGASATVVAHRWAYEFYVGPIAPGLTLDHRCRNKSCVNPTHLEPVTMRENAMRSNGITAVNARKTHCRRGHAFDEVNTRHDRWGRNCRKCDRDRTRAKRARARGGR